MKGYFRVMLGRKSVYASECFAGGFVGTSFDMNVDLTSELPDEWRVFNKKFIPVFLASHPGKSKIAAGLACGAIGTVSKGIMVGDVVLCPDGSGRHRVGEVSGSYYYQPDGILQHRRPVHWLPESIDRTDMSVALKNSTGSIGTVSTVSGYREEIEKLLAGLPAVATIVSTDPSVEDVSAFAMESHPGHRTPRSR